MKIKLEGGYTLRGDGMNYWIEKAGKSKQLRVTGFYKGLDKLLMSIPDKMLSDDSITTIEQVRDELEKTRSLIKRWVDHIYTELARKIART